MEQTKQPVYLSHGFWWRYLNIFCWQYRLEPRLYGVKQSWWATMTWGIVYGHKLYGTILGTPNPKLQAQFTQKIFEGGFWSFIVN